MEMLFPVIIHIDIFINMMNKIYNGYKNDIYLDILEGIRKNL